jgi:hypothetical protein
MSNPTSDKTKDSNKVKLGISKWAQRLLEKQILEQKIMEEKQVEKPKYNFSVDQPRASNE